MAVTVWSVSVRSNGLQDDLSSASEKVSYFSNPSWPANDRWITGGIVYV